LIGVPVADSLLLGAGDSADDGRTAGEQAALFYGFILRLGRLRLRGPKGAKDEFLLAGTAQNLRKLAKLIPLPALVFAT
jgi:hypothetical protein